MNVRAFIKSDRYRHGERIVTLVSLDDPTVEVVSKVRLTHPDERNLLWRALDAWPKPAVMP